MRKIVCYFCGDIIAKLESGSRVKRGLRVYCGECVNAIAEGKKIMDRNEVKQNGK